MLCDGFVSLRLLNMGVKKIVCWLFWAVFCVYLTLFWAAFFLWGLEKQSFLGAIF